MRDYVLLLRLLVGAVLILPLAACSGASSSVTEGNKESVRQFLRDIDALSLQEALDQNTTPGLVVHYPPSLAPEPLDRAAYEAAAGPFKVGFPDLHHTVEDIAAEGDRVWVRLTNRGTHSGEFQGIAPTGNPIVMSVMAVYRMEDGRVAELWTDGDVLGLMLQLGMELTPTGIEP